MAVLIEEIDSSLLADAPIWRYFEGASGAEIWAEPTGERTTEELSFKLIAVRVGLANGEQRWALLSNLSLNSALSNQHFLTVSVERDGRWFPLARYHDASWARHGPSGLADFLSLPLENVFPLHYNASPFVRGATVPLSGTIESEPLTRLTQRELIDLAIATSGS
jgi:hypothetical protein